MKKVITGTFAAALFAVGVSAQTPAAGQPPAQDAKDAPKTATVTGCLKAGDTPDSFMLSDLKWKDDKAVGTAGSAPAAPPVSATSLKLVGSKLSDHVGHTVEVTGTIAAKADKPADPAARPAAAAALAERQQHQDDRGDLPGSVAIRSHFVASLPARHRVGLAFCASLAIVCW